MKHSSVIALLLLFATTIALSAQTPRGTLPVSDSVFLAKYSVTVAEYHVFWNETAAKDAALAATLLPDSVLFFEAYGRKFAYYVIVDGRIDKKAARASVRQSMVGLTSAQAEAFCVWFTTWYASQYPQEKALQFTLPSAADYAMAGMKTGVANRRFHSEADKCELLNDAAPICFAGDAQRMSTFRYVARRK